MTKLKFYLALAIVTLFACNSLSIPATPVSVSESTSTGNASKSTATSAATAPAAPTDVAGAVSPSATLPAAAALTPPWIAPDGLGKAAFVKDFWPIIRKTLGLSENFQMGNLLTSWAISHDGSMLAVAGCDTEAGYGGLHTSQNTLCEIPVTDVQAHAFGYIFDTQSGREIAKLPESGQGLTITHMEFTPDDSKLVYGMSFQHYVDVWDIQANALDAVIGDARTASDAFDISPDGQTLAVGTADGEKFWDLNSKQFVAQIADAGDPRYSSDGRTILLITDPYFIFYDVETRKKITQQAMLPEDWEREFSVSPDLMLMAICDTRADLLPIQIWDTLTATLKISLPNKFGRCGKLFFTPDSKYLMVFDRHGNGPLLWEIATWKQLPQSTLFSNFVGSGDKYVYRIGFTGDGQHALVETYSRLSLFTIPYIEPPTLAPTVVGNAAATVAPTIDLNNVPTAEVREMDCYATFTGWVKGTIKPCKQPSFSIAGHFVAGVMTIELRGEDQYAVNIYIPKALQKHLSPKTYPIGDATDFFEEPRISAQLVYAGDLPLPDAHPRFNSYAETGQVVLTETGEFLSGSFKFGARDSDGYQIQVEGNFVNIPLVHANGP